MLVSMTGVRQPQTGTEPHWAKYTIFIQHPDLFDPLRSAIVREVADEITANPNGATIESPRLGARIFSTIGSWWHGEFPRRFPQFQNGDERGIFGMTLWNYLASRDDWWCFVEQADSHGYGQNSMRYWQLKPGNPLIPPGP